MKKGDSFTPVRVAISAAALAFLLAVGQCSKEKKDAGHETGDISREDVENVIRKGSENASEVAAWAYEKYEGLKEFYNSHLKGALEQTSDEFLREFERQRQENQQRNSNAPPTREM